MSTAFGDPSALYVNNDDVAEEGDINDFVNRCVSAFDTIETRVDSVESVILIAQAYADNDQGSVTASGGYSSKAWAIESEGWALAGSSGASAYTEADGITSITAGAKKYAEDAATSASNASVSATTAEGHSDDAQDWAEAAVGTGAPGTSSASSRSWAEGTTPVAGSKSAREWAEEAIGSHTIQEGNDIEVLPNTPSTGDYTVNNIRDRGNLLVDPEMVVNQGGVTTGTGMSYLADMWVFTGTGTTITKNSDGTITFSAGTYTWSTRALGFTQLPNGTYITVSVNYGSVDVYDRYNTTWVTVVAGTPQTLQFSASGDYSMTFRKAGNTSAAATIGGLKVELGEIGTNYTRPNKAEEYFKVLRYYYQINMPITGSNGPITAYRVSSSSIDMVIPLPNSMASELISGVSPSVSFINFSNSQFDEVGSTSYLTSSIPSVRGHSVGSITVRGTVGSGGTSGLIVRAASISLAGYALFGIKIDCRNYAVS